MPPERILFKMLQEMSFEVSSIFIVKTSKGWLGSKAAAWTKTFFKLAQGDKQTAKRPESLERFLIRRHLLG